MKKNVLSLMLLSLMTVSLFSCSKDDEDFDVMVSIVGEWTLTSAETLFDGKSIQEYAEESGATAQEIEFLEEINLSGFETDTKLNFQENGILVIKDSQDETNGAWSADKKTLTITANNANVIYEVKSLSDTEALISYTDPTGVYASFPIETRLTLKK